MKKEYPPRNKVEKITTVIPWFYQECHNRFLRIKEVKHITTLSVATIRRLELQGKFPKRYKLAEKVVAWDYDEIIEWMESKKKKL